MIKNIVITHGYSDSNKGDLAITQATVNGLRKTFPSAKITLLSTFRAKDEDFWYHNRKMKENDIEIIQGVYPTPYIGSKSSLFLNLAAASRLVIDIIQLRLSQFFSPLGSFLGGKQYHGLKALKQADIVIVKGGQFIYNDKEDLRGDLFLWRTLQPIKVAKKLKKKIVILGQSIGGFASEKSEKVAIKYIKMCDKIIVREDLSFNLLKKYNIGNLTLEPDMAFNINIAKIDTNFINKEVFGVTVVNWEFPEKPDVEQAKEDYIQNLIFAIKNIASNTGLTPMFIPQVTVKHHNKSDLDLIKIINKRLKKGNIEPIIVEEDFSAEEMVAVYNECKFLIGTRLHSCILATVASTPVIAIRYQGFKTQGVMDMLGYGKLVHDINNLNGNQLLKDAMYVVENHKAIQADIEARVNQLRVELDATFNSLKTL